MHHHFCQFDKKMFTANFSWPSCTARHKMRNFSKANERHTTKLTYRQALCCAPWGRIDNLCAEETGSRADANLWRRHVSHIGRGIMRSCDLGAFLHSLSPEHLINICDRRGARWRRNCSWLSGGGTSRRWIWEMISNYVRIEVTVR